MSLRRGKYSSLKVYNGMVSATFAKTMISGLAFNFFKVVQSFFVLRGSPLLVKTMWLRFDIFISQTESIKTSVGKGT